MNEKIMYLALFLLCFIGIVILVITNYNNSLIVIERCERCELCKDIVEGGERYKMYNMSVKLNTRLNGVYFLPDYYCVWTKGRSEQQINRTDCHESCHHFVYEQNEHFCG